MEKRANVIFEVSWEVCNKVGGINTVIATKAKNLVAEYSDDLIMIGPDIWKSDMANDEFIEDRQLLSGWRNHLLGRGLKVRIGRWKIEGNPIVVLVDFTTFFARKDEIFAHFWEIYGLDSLKGGWDYIEPAMFGYASGEVIASYHNFFLSSVDITLAQFHEWMTGTGILFLKDKAPYIATSFTTHATILGRTLAGNKMPLYGHLEEYNPPVKARAFNISSKYSLEKISAREADVFTTVSDLTANECKFLLEKEVDFVTPNGFEDSFVPAESKFEKKRKNARQRLKKVTEAVLGYTLNTDVFFVINSGRYEFGNKGIDVFIDSLNEIKNIGEKQIVAFITVPAHHKEKVNDVFQRMKNAESGEKKPGFITHEIYDSHSDPVLAKINALNINNAQDSQVKIIFAPIYLDGKDGIFNMSYYELLIGFDLSVFPSYYEPWGYTPMESLAFKVPTITTTLAGYGLWINEKVKNGNTGAAVVYRNDENYNEVVMALSEKILFYAKMNSGAMETARTDAKNLSKLSLWNNLIVNYFKAYEFAIDNAAERIESLDESFYRQPGVKFQEMEKSGPVWHKAVIKPNLPESLRPLEELSKNLWWTWNYRAKELFESIDKNLWEKSGNNPIILLEGIDLNHLKKLENDKEYLQNLNDVYNDFKNYMNTPPKNETGKVAYFSMEYGLDDTVKIFSGGLGILAGDYLKEASDSNMNLVAVGLIYRFGYFKQKITLFGDQIPEMKAQKFTHMPLKPVLDKNGEWLHVNIPLPGRILCVQVWQLDVGRIKLYLLDTDIEKNDPNDRKITHQLYGGGHENRFLQELVLGVGGIQLLEKLDTKPEMVHCNEGHAALTTIERLKNFVQNEKLSFEEAVELVRSSTLFTTHTPVPAGHDAFEEHIVRTYLPQYGELLGISWEKLVGLGRVNEKNAGEKFSMSILAAKLSQEINGVSKIHGRVSRKMFSNMYPGYYPNELHLTHVTNGVHFPTWVAKNWSILYHEKIDKDFNDKQEKIEMWKKIKEVKDETIWDVRNRQRNILVNYLKKRLEKDLTSRQVTPKIMVKTLRTLKDDVLTIGFARRFATYKRAHLLFSNLERLSALVNNSQKPIQFVFAGKAHPADKAGQDLIKRIIEVSQMPEFMGKIVFIENYDMELGKKLVQGVDVWLNNPTRPLEASGTSGEKAVMNGVLNLSVLDGWWAEGYIEGAGWALPEERTYSDQNAQDSLDVAKLYSLLENEISGLFYKRDDKNIPVKWIAMIKKNIAEIAPHFTMNRMLHDYIDKFYKQQMTRSVKLKSDNYALAREIANWKRKILENWNDIEVLKVKHSDSSIRPLVMGKDFEIKISLRLKNLNIDEIGVEVIFSKKNGEEVTDIIQVTPLEPKSFKNDVAKYSKKIQITYAGVFNFAFRVFPKNDKLPHRQDFPLVKWI